VKFNDHVSRLTSHFGIEHFPNQQSEIINHQSPMDEPGFTRLANCKVAIVGLGLMGGSLALALRGRCREIVGVSRSPETIDFALAHGIIDREATFEASVDCDLLVLAAPVRTILAQLDQLAQSLISNQQSTIVIDLGSTKTQIVSAMQALPSNFDPIGGHPMCGKESSGITNAEATLYQGKTFVLTPLPRTSSTALALAHELIAIIGSVPFVLPAEQHDALVAVSSHLPYLVSTNLVRTAQVLDDPQLWKVAASGFRDTSRLAASDVTMMLDILLTNRAAILNALTLYIEELDLLAAIIDAGDPDEIRAALEPAQAKRSELFK
jgi:prephenate dehydrogenase